MKSHIALILSFTLLVAALSFSLVIPSAETTDKTNTSSYRTYPASNEIFHTRDIVYSMETKSHFFKAEYTGKYVIRGCYLDLCFKVTENIIGKTSTEEIMIELTYATTHYGYYPLDQVKFSDSTIKALWHTFEAGEEYLLFTTLSKKAYDPYDVYKLLNSFYGPLDDIEAFRHSIINCVADRNAMADMLVDPITGSDLEPSEVHSRFISYIKEQAKEHPLNGWPTTNAVCIRENNPYRIIKESPKIFKVKVINRGTFHNDGDYYNQEYYWCELISTLKGETTKPACNISFFPGTAEIGEEYIVCSSTAEEWPIHLSSKYGVFPASEENRIIQIIAEFEN